MPAKPTCYVANPYGFAEGTKYWYDEVLLPRLSRFITVLDPWSVDVSGILAASDDERPELWVRLGLHHYATIDTKAKLVIAILDQEPPDNGTVCEVVWAAAHGIPVIAYRNDLRTAGENGMSYNLMIAAAIRLSGGFTVSSLEELEQKLPDFISNLIEA